MKKIDLQMENASTLADLVADPQTTDHLRVRIIQELLETREGQDFFKTMYEEGLSFGDCPKCGHQNHWAIPEDVLNQMGWVSFEKDPEIKELQTAETCPEFQEAHFKKKVVI